jgi:hypothetical protein
MATVTVDRWFLDANILVYATLVSHPLQLLTNNVADFARFAGLITVVPLVP